MKQRKIFPLILSALLLAAAVSVNTIPADARKSRSKASTAQSAKNSKKNKSKKNSSDSSKSKNSKKSSYSSAKRSSGYSGSSYTRQRSNRSSSAPKAEVPQNDSLTLAVNSSLIECIPADQNPGGLRVNSVKLDNKSRTATINLNENFTYLPVNQQYITGLQNCAARSLPDSIHNYRVNLNVSGHPLSYYISTVDKLPEKYRKNTPFVTPAHPYVNAKKGMEGDIIALWSSHGRYYKNGSWQWQRPLLFETLEDTYTMSYVTPFLVPMLENAGAYPILPRERDTNRHEVIVDNDTNPEGEIFSQNGFQFVSGSKKWEVGDGEGFIYDLPDFRDTENPFENGTYYQTSTIRTGKPSKAAWYANIPEDGEYAVYVSYKSLPNSTEDAHYIVNYSGGSKEFIVNQTMGGSTWVYLGTFPLEAGYSDTEPIVALTNISDKAADKIVTADAVKIGGGMGNIARSPHRSDIYYDPSTPESTPQLAASQQQLNDDADDDDDDDDDDDGDDEGDDDDEDIDDEDNSAAQPATPSAPVKKGNAPRFSTSGLPRYLEGARYWLHWAGFPEKIYSPYHGGNDYKDDYTCRGHWVNYLAGGSRVLPNREGLHIPVDMSFALHSDAGKRSDDSFVGTLGIYYTNGGANYVDGTPRRNSRFLTDLLMRQITGDIRQLYEPSWTRRSMWDKSYLESRVAEVPTALIELMSHQNFGDMQYGLDPNFRFDVARSMYKAMARFMAERKGREVVIQPLPVKNFAIQRHRKSVFRLSWQPSPDPLEPTAMPNKYIIFERSANTLGFHVIGETSETHFDVKVQDHDIHSFRIVAANDGGTSFPSETLVLREGEDGSTPVLIVNGFTRVSAPAHFSENGRAGFNSEEDFGVPFIKDISFSGHQTEFRRSAGEGFGRSNSNYINMVIPGNTFDFPLIHGNAIAASRQGFVSCSIGALENGSVKLSDYKIVDLILGKQKTSSIGRGKAQKSAANYTAFPAYLQKQLSAYTSKGGRLLVSGQYVASDLESAYSPAGSESFAENVLGIQTAEGATKSHNGSLNVLANAGDSGSKAATIKYSNTLNEKQYIVERPDALTPSSSANSFPLLQFADSNEYAGLLNKIKNSRVAVLSVPFESISDAKARNSLMNDILKFLSK